MAVRRNLSTQGDQFNYTGPGPVNDFPLPPGGLQTDPTGPGAAASPGRTYIPGLPQTDFGGGNPEQQNRQIGDTFGTNAPLGFDATKWKDQGHLSDKYLIGHILAGSGSLDDAVAAMNQRTPGGGWKKVSEDSIMDPTGHVDDLYFDYGGPNQHLQWYDVPGTGGYPAAPNGNGGGGGGNGGGGGGLGNISADALQTSD
jgi:hypothetical protein